MGEPWLDSLSEDWNSEPHLSSPASSLANSRYGSQNNGVSQSRIPHLAHSMRRDSSSGFLKPRSARGRAKANGMPILSERSASSLNMPSQTAQNSSKKRLTSSTLPRRASSKFSDSQQSQQSVQHHTVHTSQRETPEWKRRLQNGEDIASDGFDLFSPSKLEGIFSQPAQPSPEQENQSTFGESDAKPWTALKASNLSAPTDQYLSYRTSRSRAPPMESLPELSEDEVDDELEHSMSAISSELVRGGSMQGLVPKRVADLEHQSDEHDEHDDREDGNRVSYASRDPRWRTISGQQEMRNEDISPATASAKNTISERAVRGSVDLNPQALKKKLMEASSEQQRRPSSRSSDRDISYDGGGSRRQELLHEESLADMTSHSLPEDLSMGTQDFVSNGAYVNLRRGAASNETSFLVRKLSSLDETPELERRPVSGFRSSPPPYDLSGHHSRNHSRISTTDLTEPQDESVLHHDTSPQRPTSAGSPLKLFGNRDTYTNNKLLRVLSQFEDGSDLSKLSDDEVGIPTNAPHSEAGLRMSQFGKGELDTFNFVKEVQRPTTAPAALENDGDRIFQSLADSTIEGENTIFEQQPIKTQSQQGNHLDLDAKRLPSLVSTDRSPKRRRTLVRDEITVEGVDIEVRVDRVLDTTSLAGRKRKDARPGEGGAQADPEVLASRAILRPKPGSRKSSNQSQNSKGSQASTVTQQNVSEELKEALAAELASFAQGMSEAQRDSRKPSLATKDYMEEANKVMEFIRARGKPIPKLPEVQEPNEVSELDADRILDLELDEDSTQEPFSRPPSREGPTRPREDRRIAKHDPQTENHLRRFKDSDDLEILASTSIIGTLNLPDNRLAAEAATVALPVEEQESSPPNIRILNPNESQRKRKHTASSENGQANGTQSSGSFMRQTFATESSGSFGQKGIINSGTVSIPDRVGTMTFDHEKQIWVKQNLAQIHLKQRESRLTALEPRDETTLDDDPFKSIPDLSIDEQQEEAMRVMPKSSRPSTANTTQSTGRTQPSGSHRKTDVGEIEDSVLRHVSATLDDDGTLEGNHFASHDSSSARMPASLRSEASKHEERLYNGIASQAPTGTGTSGRQPRVVTIAFSSPVASEIPRQRNLSSPAPDSEDEKFLPPEDSDDDIEYLKTPRNASSMKERSTSSIESRQDDLATLRRRPVSRIDEGDENDEQNEGLSLVRVTESQATTPESKNQVAAKKPASVYKGASILCLTPLSEFTMHQADKANHPEESFVQARANPKALLQAHGSLALSVDTLVKAITDAAPDELFWEQLRELDLSDSRLPSTHGLDDYCSSLEVLDISKNLIAQLDGLPSSVRHLNASENRLNDFTSWARLQNLQYVDVSKNQLENLESLSSLVHMRRLRACDNKISDIEGIVDLDGLIALQLQGNRMTQLDLEGVDMPRLEELDLKDNKLASVRNLHCLPQLKRLDLSGNSLRGLHVSEPLPRLKHLSISRNELETLNLAMFPALIELDLDGNCIKNIEGLSQAANLRKLSVREQRNSTGILDLVLTTPNECSEIYLSSNMLAHGQMELPRYPHYNLRRLEIAACGLRVLPQGFGDYFPNCRTLNLNFNAVSDLSPLLGAVKLRKLLVASNRIKRLRRTCLVLSRMPGLEKVDTRDNPLTLGFYAPEQGKVSSGETYLLPPRSISQDTRWLQLLDETTFLRRRMLELLLAQGCDRLTDLDGSPFVKDGIIEHDSAWDNLTAKGILMRAIEAPPARPTSPDAICLPVKNIAYDGTTPAFINDIDEMDMQGRAEEQHVTVG